MPGSASAGTALGVAKNRTSVAYRLPKICDIIEWKCRHGPLKDALMKLFGSA